MSRCKACDSKLWDDEIVWRHEHETFEDLCLVCRAVIKEAEDDMDTDILYPEDDYSDIVPARTNKEVDDA